MRDAWPEIPIAEIGRVVTGKTPSTKCPNLYGDKYPFITPTDIFEEYDVATPSRFLSEEGFDLQKSLLLPRNAVCFTCIASIGKMCITVEPSFTNQQINSIIVDESRHDYRTGRLLSGNPLRGGQVGDFVVVDCDSHALLGRILEVKLPEKERLDIEQQLGHTPDPHPVAKLHLLGALQTGTDKVISGIPNYPALGASVFAASAELVSHFASSFSLKDETDEKPVTLKLGHVRDGVGTPVEIRADHLFARHCAILGATGGGKSTTIARLLEQCLGGHLFPKIILTA